MLLKEALMLADIFRANDLDMTKTYFELTSDDIVTLSNLRNCYRYCRLNDSNLNDLVNFWETVKRMTRNVDQQTIERLCK